MFIPKRVSTNNIIMNLNQLITLLPASQWVFWKDLKSIYRGCNNAFSYSTGFGSPKNIIGMKASHLKPLHYESSKELEKIDQMVFDTSKSFELTKYLYFEDDQLNSLITAKIIPIISDSEKIQGIFGIARIQ